MFVYISGFCFIGVHYTLADKFEIEMTNLEGQPIKTAITTYINQDELNERSQNILEANYQQNSTIYSKIETFTTAAAYVAWELIALITGVYIFYIMLLFGIDAIWVVSFIAIYIFLVGRAILGYVRGV
jgi:hypothetical protein